MTATGGTTPYAFALSGATLPAGMSFNTTTGTVSGTPTATLVTTTFTVTATDTASATSAKTFTLTVNPALVTTQAVPSVTGTNGTSIPPFTPVTATGGTLPYSFALAGGTLPPGMTFNTGTGQVSGTPTASLATTTFTVTVSDAAGAISAKTFALTVNPGLATTQLVASKSGTSGTLIPSFTPVTASGGTVPYAFALSGGVLPAGMSFTIGTGLVSGTPSTTLATTTFTVMVTDAAGATSAKTFALTVNAALVITQAVPSTTGTSGTLIPPFTPVTATGGTVPLAYALSGGTLPSSMSFSTSSGQVSGTPTTTLATTTFTVTVTDAAGATSSKTFTLRVNTALTTTQAVASRTGDSGTAIATFTPVTAGGGTTPYAFALSGGTLPTGLTYSGTTGAVAGTPTATLSTTTFTVTVTDAASATSSKTFTLTVNSALSTSQAVSAKTVNVGTALSPFIPVTAGGGTPPYGFALTGGLLPTGVNFSTSTGTVSGTPTTTLATTTFTVTVTDAIGVTSSRTFSLTVNGALTTAQAVPSTTGTSGTLTPSFTPVTAGGGTPPYTFALTGGTLPAGMSFNTATGQVSGTPSAAMATTTFTVTVTDAVAATSSRTFTLTVNGPLSATQAVPATSVPVGSLVAPFTPVAAAGGTSPYTYALSGGSLPPGMNFSTSTGQLSGTPGTTLATTTFTVTVTDAAASTASNAFALTVTGIMLNIGNSPAVSMTAGQDITIPINIDMSNAAGADLASLQVNVTWDPSRFAFKSQTAGNWLDGDGVTPAFVIANPTTGQLSIQGFTINSGTTTSFTLQTLTLTSVVSGTPIVTPVAGAVTAAGNTLGAAVLVVPRNLSVTINP